MRVVVAKPYGPDFQALVKAQRHHGALPHKLTEMIIHPQAAGSSQNPLSVLSLSSLASQDSSAAMPSQGPSTHQTSIQPTYIQNTPNQIGSGQAGPSKSITPPGSGPQVPLNKSGQRVDPQIDALAWFISTARKRRICYEYHLMGYCTWGPTPCRNAHGTETLSVHEMNALQVLARELPCHKGNACPDWACCFGHRCPFGGRCNKGEGCRFPREMHITDLKVVR